MANCGKRSVKNFVDHFSKVGGLQYKLNIFSGRYYWKPSDTYLLEKLLLPTKFQIPVEKIAWFSKVTHDEIQFLGLWYYQRFKLYFSPCRRQKIRDTIHMFFHTSFLPCRLRRLKYNLNLLSGTICWPKFYPFKKLKFQQKTCISKLEISNFEIKIRKNLSWSKFSRCSLVDGVHLSPNFLAFLQFWSPSTPSWTGESNDRSIMRMAL